MGMPILRQKTRPRCQAGPPSGRKAATATARSARPRNASARHQVPSRAPRSLPPKMCTGIVDERSGAGGRVGVAKGARRREEGRQEGGNVEASGLGCVFSLLEERAPGRDAQPGAAAHARAEKEHRGAGLPPLPPPPFAPAAKRAVVPTSLMLWLGEPEPPGDRPRAKKKKKERARPFLNLGKAALPHTHTPRTTSLSSRAAPSPLPARKAGLLLIPTATRPFLSLPSNFNHPAPVFS